MRRGNEWPRPNEYPEKWSYGSSPSTQKILPENVRHSTSGAGKENKQTSFVCVGRDMVKLSNISGPQQNRLQT